MPTVGTPGRARRSVRHRGGAAAAALSAEARQHYEALAQDGDDRRASWAPALRAADTARRGPLQPSRNSHEPEQAHREGPGSRPRRAAARRARSTTRRSSRSTCWRPWPSRPTASCPAVLRKIERRSRAGRHGRRAPSWRSCRRRTAARSPCVSPRFRAVSDAAFAEAERLKDEYVSTEHLLLAIASEPAARRPPGCSSSRRDARPRARGARRPCAAASA